MHFAIDFLAVVLLLLIFWMGWRKGMLLAFLGVLRVLLAGSIAYFMGRYIGPWMGSTLNRPRIVMMPVMAGLSFVLISFCFQLLRWKIREGYRKKEEKEDFHLAWYSRLGGGTVSMAAGLFTMILLFWLAELVVAGLSGKGVPGADQSVFGRFAHRAAYEGVYMATAKKGRESQAAAIARVVSNPSKGLDLLERVLDADSIKQLLDDRKFANDVLSGDPERIEQNASLQRLFNDRATLEEMKELGIFSGKEKKSELCEKLSYFGRNQNIKISIQNLKAKDLLHADKILELVRDPDFDVIVGEMLK